MEPLITDHDDIGHDEPSVHNWRVSQLKRLGVPGSLAAEYTARSVSRFNSVGIGSGRFRMPSPPALQDQPNGAAESAAIRRSPFASVEASR